MKKSTPEVLNELKNGNQRFVSGNSQYNAERIVKARTDLSEKQNPSAIVIGCSDSRVPIEILFDQGLGELFVIRVAGNIIAPTLIASVEYAVENFATPLVVILGHSNCGAIKATISHLESELELRSVHLLEILKRIEPSIIPLLQSELRYTKPELISAGVKANIQSSVKQLESSSTFLAQECSHKRLKILGAEYCLQTGKVTFL